MLARVSVCGCLGGGGGSVSVSVNVSVSTFRVRVMVRIKGCSKGEELGLVMGVSFGVSVRDIARVSVGPWRYG